MEFFKIICNMENRVKFKSGASKEAEDFIGGLLRKDPRKRLGLKGGH